MSPHTCSQKLPLELLHIIAARADKRSLTQLCLANSVLGEVAATYLYRTLLFSKFSTAVRCLKTISKHPALAKHVRTLCFQRNLPRKPNLTSAFGTLLRRALLNMPHLASLTLDACPDGIARYLRGSPFRVKEVSLACLWDEHVTAWLGEQPYIQRFLFYGHAPPTISLPSSTIPNLQCIYALPSVIKRVVPGRPVTRVFVTVYSPETFTASTVESVARSCKSSTGPISAVYLIHSTSRGASALPPVEIFEVLSSIPKYLPRLSKFSMQLSVHSWNEPLWEMLRDFVASFRHLKYLDLFPGADPGAKSGHSQSSTLARSFGERCPSLRGVRFSPDSFHAHHPTGHWVSLWDIGQLQTEIISTCALLQSSLSADRPSAGQVHRASSSRLSHVKGSPEVACKDIISGLLALRAARTTMTTTYLDVFSPEADADMAAAINFAYSASRQLLEILKVKRSGSTPSV